MLFILFNLFFIYFCWSNENTTSFSDYETKVEIPEPLFIDLVRGLHSHRGEWELNSLLNHTQGTYSELHWAPEVEWVIKDGSAVEFEFPMVGSQLESYKFAFQQRTYRSSTRSTFHGLQLIYQANTDFSRSEGTLFFIAAHRFNHYYSSILLVGGKTILEKTTGVDGLFNLSLFYNYSDEVDLGLETNYSSGHFSNRLLQLVPQLHLALNDGMKIQFGFGTRQDEDKWSPTTTLRLIKEFNKQKKY